MDTKKKPILIPFLLLILFISIPHNLLLICLAVSSPITMTPTPQKIKALSLMVSIIFSILSIINLFKKKRKSLYYFSISMAPIICFFILRLYFEIFIEGIPTGMMQRVITSHLITPVWGISIIVYSLRNKDTKKYLSN